MSTLVLTNTRSYARDFILILTGTLIITLCAQLSLTIPFTAIPFSLQPHAVLFIASCLGPKRGVICVAAYLLEGVMGMPVFSHGRSTLLHLLSPSGGYLLSYLPVSYLVGTLATGSLARNAMGRFLSLLAGNTLILLMGTLWLIPFTGLQNAIIIGFAPFIATDLVKTLMVTRLMMKVQDAQNFRV